MLEGTGGVSVVVALGSFQTNLHGLVLSYTDTPRIVTIKAAQARIPFDCRKPAITRVKQMGNNMEHTFLMPYRVATTKIPRVVPLQQALLESYLEQEDGINKPYPHHPTLLYVCNDKRVEVTDAQPTQQWLQHASLMWTDDATRSALEVQTSDAPLDVEACKQIVSDIEDVLPDESSTIVDCLADLRLIRTATEIKAFEANAEAAAEAAAAAATEAEATATEGTVRVEAAAEAAAAIELAAEAPAAEADKLY